MQKKFRLKQDKFRKARGGWSRLLEICCRKCCGLVCTYQKDGPGNLRRLYLDRIFAPERLLRLQNKKVGSLPQLKCNKCSEILGTPYIYKKEKRKAFRLYQDAVVKKVGKI